MMPLPGCTPTKPGSACYPFFGVVAVILDEAGKVIINLMNLLAWALYARIYGNLGINIFL